MGYVPKKSEHESLSEIEDYVKDAILTEDFSDEYFASLFELTLTAKSSGRHLFANPMDEPLFYRRHFVRWIEEGMEEKRNMANYLNK